MTTFQAIIYGIIQGFTRFLPVSAEAHREIVPYLVNWPEPSGVLLGAFSLGSTLAVLLYFIHDWASMLSSAIQVVLFRRRPMTIDERMPMFIVAATIPICLAAYFWHEKLSFHEWDALWVAGSLAAFTIPLWLAEHFSRKSKNMYDWSWIDSLTVGVAQIAALIPGAGQSSSSLTGAFFRNYSREAAAKFTFFISAPWLIALSILELRDLDIHAAHPMPDLSWLSFFIALVVTFLTSLLAIGALMKQIQRKGVSQYVAYRLLLAALTAGAFWMRNRS